MLAQSLLWVAAILLLALQPSPEWVERHFSNGYYAAWQNHIASLTLLLPFSLGDVVGLAFIAAVVLILIAGHRARKQFGYGVALVGVIRNVGMLTAIVVIWFYVSWGWGYMRAPVETRVRYQPTLANERAAEALRKEAITEINALAPRAHAVSGGRFDRDALRAAWLPVVQRLGDTWTPLVGRTKVSIAAPLMNANGTSGFVNPFTVESQLATDLLWFEVPFTTAHEWSHAAGFNREDEANYIAVVSCLRDRDVVAAYSGWLELFLYLPPLAHYPRSTFVPLVWSDFQALQERNSRYLNVRFSRVSWRAYNNYLKSNHIASGVENYNEVTRLFLAVPRDAEGLPETRI